MTLYRYETGARTPRIADVSRMAELLGTSIAELLGVSAEHDPAGDLGARAQQVGDAWQEAMTIGLDAQTALLDSKDYGPAFEFLRCVRAMPVVRCADELAEALRVLEAATDDGLLERHAAESVVFLAVRSLTEAVRSQSFASRVKTPA